MRPEVPLDSRFELVNELGRGGMGIVYRARDRERGGEVALKALREVGGAELLRLKREFRVMCNVRHPNLVRLGELVEQDGGWFFTMELVDGVDFLTWVGAPEPPEPESRRVTEAVSNTTVQSARSTSASRSAGADDATRTITGEPRDGRGEIPLPPDVRPMAVFDEHKLRTALRGVAEGLAGLHRAGLVHRDVKPSNIKVDANGRVVLLDFGVTVPLHDVDSEIAGTYAYMAPEQAVGNATAASDWYAVGVMLFRAMTGYVPFPATRHGLELKSRMSAPSPDGYVQGLPDDLVELCSALLAMDPARRAGEAEVRAVTGALPSSRTSGSISVPFVGRVRELARLLAARDRQHRDGGCVIALVRGPSGVGKTSLVRHFLEDQVAAHTDTIFLESRCDERESVPFNALDGIVDGLARFVARHRERLPARALDALRSPDAAELRRLFPVLADAAAGSTPRTQQSVQSSRAAAARALRELLDATGAARSLVLMIDDAQWADADSCSLLADVLASPAPSVLVLVTARGDGIPALLAPLNALPLEDIALSGLDPGEAVDLVGALAADATIDAAAIVREADGHPMFIAELSRFAAERRDTAGSLDDALWARACDLSAPARRLLHVIATDGAVLPRPIAVKAAELAPDEAADAIAELRAARLIRAGDDVVEPYHDRVREALVGRLPREESTALHLVLARALDAADAAPERLANHWAGAGERERAAECARAAGRRASDALAFDRASEWLAMALDLGTYDPATRRALLVERADALSHAGRPREAATAFLDASRTGEPDALEQRDLRRRAAQRFLAGGYTHEGVAVARELLAEIDVPWPPTRSAALRSLAWHHVRMGATRLEWVPRDESEIPAEQKLRLDTCWSIGVGLAMVDPMRGTTFVMRALRLALEAGDPRRLAFALAACAFAAAGMNQQRRLRRLTAAIDRLAAATDVPEARCYVALADAARTYFFDNNWPRTREVAARGLEVWTEARGGHTWESDLFEQFIGWGHGTAGEHRAAAEHAERVVRGAHRRGDLYLEVAFRTQFPQRYFLADRAEDGIRDVDDAIGRWPVPEGLERTSNAHYWHWRARVLFALYADRTDADAEELEEGWRRLASSLVWQVPAVRLEISTWAGAFALARAVRARRAGAKSELRSLIAQARRHQRTIAAIPLPARESALGALSAALAYVSGDTETAVSELRAALPIVERFHYRGTAMSARYRLGRLIGGSEGEALVAEAQAWVSRQNAVQPERIFAIHMPVLDA